MYVEAKIASITLLVPKNFTGKIEEHQIVF